jgi:hypothetical protein
MSTTTKSSSATAGTTAQIAGFFTEYANGVSQGLERLTELRRVALDAATLQQNELATAWKKGAELAVDGYRQAAQAQKDLFEAAVERGREAAKLATANTESATKTVAGAIAVLEELAGHATLTQKKAADFAATQNATVYSAAQQQFEASGAAAAETLQRGVDTLLETQKIVLGAKAAA